MRGARRTSELHEAGTLVDVHQLDSEEHHVGFARFAAIWSHGSQPSFRLVVPFRLVFWSRFVETVCWPSGVVLPPRRSA